MSAKLTSNKPWVLWALSAFVVVITLTVTLAPPGDSTFRASSSILLTLEGPVGEVDDAVDRLQSADTGNAVGTLLQLVSSSDLHQRAMEEVGIEPAEADRYRVTVTSPGDALMVTVEVAGPGPEVVDVAEEIGNRGSELAAGSFPGLTLVSDRATLPKTTDEASAIYPLLSMGVGLLATLVIVGGAFFGRGDAKATGKGLKEVVRDWIEGKPVPVPGRFGPWPHAWSTGVVVAAVAGYLLVAPGQALWLAFGVVAGLSMLVALRFPRPLAIGLVVLVLFNLSDIGTDFFGLPGISVPYTVFVIIVVAIRSWALGEDRRGWLGLAVAIAALVAVMSISGMTAADQPLAFERTVDLVKNGLVAILMVVLIRDLDDLRRVVWVLILGASFLSVLGIFLILMGDVPGLLAGFSQVVTEVVDEEVVGVRIAGPIGDANYFGQFLVLVFPFALDRTFRERNWLPRVTAAVAALLIASAVILTYSRGALIGMIVAAVLAMVLLRPPLRVVVVALFVSAVVLISIPSQYLERIGSLVQVVQIGSATGVDDASLQGRFGEMLVGLEMFHDYPVAGIGPGNYPGRYLEYSSTLGIDYRLELRQPHSLPIEVAAELGVLGLIWWSVAAYLLVSRLLAARRAAPVTGNTELRHYLDALCASFAGFAATALFLHLAFARSFWMLMGIAVAAIRLSHTQTSVSAPIPEYQVR